MASYKLILDRMVGSKHLHEKCVVGAAGNLDTDNALAESMSTALQSRMIHLELRVDHEGWLKWASENGLSHWITDHIRFKPGNLYTFKPDHSDHTYASPRTWQFANDALQQYELNDPCLLPHLAGTISEGVAREFLSFCSIYKDLPKIEEIMDKPETITVPEEPSVLYALTGSIAHNVKDENFEKLWKYIRRLPAEFQVITMHETIHRNMEMLKHPAFVKWTAEAAAKFI